MIIDFLFEALLLGFSTGIIAAIYLQVLAKEKILNWWFRFGARFEDKWFFDPIWGCIKCIAGQMALWSYVFSILIPSIRIEVSELRVVAPPDLFYTENYFCYFLGLIVAIMMSIFVGMLAARVLTILLNSK